MKIAIPLAQGKLCAHFGHCEAFALIDVNREEKKILGRNDVTAPPHEPGMLPGWLRQRGVDLIIAGGMGMRALELFAGMGIDVKTGAASDTPEKIVEQWMEDKLVFGNNACDH